MFWSCGDAGDQEIGENIEVRLAGQRAFGGTQVSHISGLFHRFRRYISTFRGTQRHKTPCNGAGDLKKREN